MKNNQKGFVVILFSLMVMAVTAAIALSAAFLTLGQQKISYNIIKSTQAYYTAESGIEDIILRLSKNVQWTTPYVLAIGGGSTTVQISSAISGSRTIISNGNERNRFRKLNIVYQVTTSQISFFYGVQAGDGGVEMGNNSRIKGNIFSNGSVISETGIGYIDNNIIVAHNGNKIDGLDIGQDALVYSCVDSTVHRNLIYVPPGVKTSCSVTGSTSTRTQEIEPEEFPISQNQIDKWKQEAENGGIISGNYTISGKITQNLGPKKITGDLLIDNNAILNMTGTIWVVGNLRIDNGATIKLDLNSYGSKSGVIVVDGKIKVKPGTHLEGSEEEESYLLLLSTNPEVLDRTNPAIDADNNTDAAIFYTTQGLIVLRNNIKAREVTGYKVFLDNNAEILYEAGLAEAFFTSGPGGSWEVASWKEIE